MLDKVRPAKYRALIRNAIARPAIDLLRDTCEVSIAEAGEIAADSQVVLVRSDKIDTDLYTELLALGRAGTGVDNIDGGDPAKASARGIPIFYAPGANANSVVELATALMGVCARNVLGAHEFAKSIDPNLGDEAIHKLVEKNKARFRGFELMGKTLGIVGMGNIGGLLARRAAHLEMQVVGFDPFISEEVWEEKFGPTIKRVSSLKQLMRRADIVSVHVDLSAKTRKLINAELLAEMKDGAILMNLARGPICDEDALLDVLGRKISTFVTDFPTERLVPHPYAICLPHLGASTEEAEERAGLMAAKSLVEYLRFGIVTNSVNFPTLEVRPRTGIKMRLAIPHRNIPGIIGLVGDAIRDAGGNIGPFHNDTKNGLGYCVADLENVVPLESIVGRLHDNSDVLAVRSFIF